MPQRSIERIGFREFLDGNKVLHNGHGFDRYLHIRFELEWPPIARAKEFSVKRRTMELWDNKYDKEASGAITTPAEN